MKFEDSSAAVVVDDHHGIYVGQVFAQHFEEHLRRNGFDEESLQILLTGPDHENYTQTWADELFPVRMKGVDGKEFVFFNYGDGGDVWELPAEEYDQIEWEEL